MSTTISTPEQYLIALPDERRQVLSKLREVILKNLPKGFEEMISYGMLGYVVPHKLYPSGYHCDPKLPLPFISLASQKNFIALYHMGLYADTDLLTWFHGRWTEVSKKKLDMGKSCIRFKKEADIPMELVGELVAKVSPAKWIEIYERNVKNR